MTLGPLMIDVAGPELQPDEGEMLRHPLVGSVILFTRNYAEPAQLAKLVADIHAARSPALIVAVDHEGGRVQRFREGFSRLPAARRVGHEYDVDPRAGLELARAMGWLMAAELRAHGVDLSFAPCVDLDHGASEVIGDRSFHADPAVVGELAVAYMHGMREAGMAATGKHFPGHGAVIADSHLSLPVDRRSLVDIEPDLAPYRQLIVNGLPAVMAAHVLYPGLDDALPASLSARWLRGILRQDLGFQGVIFSDDLSMGGAAAAFGDIVARAERALAAGCDVLPVCNDRAAVISLLDRLHTEPEPASRLRFVRLRGRDSLRREDLLASNRWAQCRDALARCSAPPPLTLESGEDG